jgi:hypothetical protein
MHLPTDILGLLRQLVSVVAHVAFVLGPVASGVAVVVKDHWPRIALAARILAAWGPDLPAFLHRLARARRSAAAQAPVDAGAATAASASRLAAAIIDTANRQCAVLLELYRQEGFAALYRSQASAEMQTDLRAALIAVDSRWSPVWSAWRALRAAEMALSLSVREEAGTTVVGGDERTLACALRAFRDVLPAPAAAAARELVATSTTVGGASAVLCDVDSALGLIINTRERVLRELGAIDPGASA